MPPHVDAWMETWRVHHPGWEYRLWTDSNIPVLRNQVQFESAAAMAVKADIARVEILQTFGGVYIDADYECLKSIEPIVRGASAIVLSEGDGSITNSFIGSVADHPLLGILVDEMSSIDPAELSSPDFDPLPWTGPKLWTRIISHEALVFTDDFRLLPPDFFVTPKTRVRELLELSELRRYGTHHALATWRKDGGVVDLIRKTRLRTRLRRFFDLSAV